MSYLQTAISVVMVRLITSYELHKVFLQTYRKLRGINSACFLVKCGVTYLPFVELKSDVQDNRLFPKHFKLVNKGDNGVVVFRF